MNDYKEFLLSQLKGLGIEIDEGTELLAICIKYFNLMKRLIIPRPRAIHISKELSKKQLIEEIQKSFETIKRIANKGGNLNHYLSLNILDLEFNDDLINDWGIHHLHLGNTPNRKNPFFVKGTPALLYLIVEEEAIYLIDILDHSSFANKYLIEVVHSNWPRLLEPYAMRGILSGKSYADEDRKKLRRAGVTTATQIGDKLYMPRGGGVSLSGLNAEIPLQAAHELKRFKEMESHIKENACMFISEIKKRKKMKVNKLDFRLYLENSKVYVRELNSDMVFLMYSD